MIGWLFHAPLWLVLTAAALYNIFATSDSGALSASVTELADPALLGATLAVQSCLGFLAAAVSPGVAGFVLDAFQSSGSTSAASPWQWGPAFGVLGLGVLMGPLSLWAMRRGHAKERLHQ
jgi:MFS family permease